MDIAISHSALVAFFEVIGIDLLLAADNALVIGIAAAGLSPKLRRKAVIFGIIAATILRIVLALITTQLLSVVGLLLAGGLLLLWVTWRMYREMRDTAQEEAMAQEVLQGRDLNAVGSIGSPVKTKTLKQAVIQILIADVSMSLDNVLAVAGAARDHPEILVFGLLLSIALMGLAANGIASLLHRHRWIGYIGVVVIAFVAIKMIFEGAEQIMHAAQII